MNKKILIILILSVLLNTVFTTYAEPDNTVPSPSATQTQKDTEGKATPTPAPDNKPESAEIDPSSPVPHAASALLADIATGKVLFSKNPDQRVYPASTTKIMTAILVLDNDTLSDVVTATQEAIEPITNKHSHMGILVGEELTVEQLLYGMLVYSANDAANVLAVHTAGSLDAFVEMMNNKAAELGASGTHFVNPHGFHDDNHYTTANDLFVISRCAMQNEKFREIVKTDRYVIPETNKYHETRYLSSTNHLISRRRYANYFYDKAIGIKTGFTDEAGSCLVSAASNGETEFISIVMKCDNTTTVENGAYSFIDSKNLLQYGFDNFKHITIASTGDIVSDSKVYEAKDNIRVALTVENNISGILPKEYKTEDIKQTITFNSKNISAPIKKGDIIGTVSYEYKGEAIGTSNLTATNDVEKDYIIAAIHLFLKIVFNPIFIIILILLIILRTRAKILQRKRRRQRRSRMKYVNDNDNNYRRRR